MIMHRDLKTLNVFLVEKQKIKVKSHLDNLVVLKLGDLGVSILMQKPGEFHKTRVGTPIYLAPELVKHEP